MDYVYWFFFFAVFAPNCDLLIVLYSIYTISFLAAKKKTIEILNTLKKNRQQNSSHSDSFYAFFFCCYKFFSYSQLNYIHSFVLKLSIGLLYVKKLEWTREKEQPNLFVTLRIREGKEWGGGGGKNRPKKVAIKQRKKSEKIN